MAETAQHQPLMFTFRDAISGNGFLAGITSSGRALVMQEEDGRWWMYGVRPGAIAESGENPQETVLNFRNRHKEVLFDMAAECKDFEEFKHAVERFFYEPDAIGEDEQKWEEAVKAIRSGKLIPPEPFSKLKREAPEDRPTFVAVERLDVESKIFVPSDNVRDTYSLPMAA